MQLRSESECFSKVVRAQALNTAFTTKPLFKKQTQQGANRRQHTGPFIEGKAHPAREARAIKHVRLDTPLHVILRKLITRGVQRQSLDTGLDLVQRGNYYYYGGMRVGSCSLVSCSLVSCSLALLAHTLRAESRSSCVDLYAVTHCLHTRPGACQASEGCMEVACS